MFVKLSNILFRFENLPTKNYLHARKFKVHDNFLLECEESNPVTKKKTNLNKKKKTLDNRFEKRTQSVIISIIHP